MFTQIINIIKLKKNYGDVDPIITMFDVASCEILKYFIMLVLRK